MTKYSNFRGARIIEVLKIEVNEGDGKKGDPIRRVCYLCSKNGKILAKLGEEHDRIGAMDEGNNELVEL